MASGAKKKIRKLRRKLKASNKALRRATRIRTTTTSPLAPKDGFPDLPEVKGVRLAAIEAGVRYKGRPDVMLAEMAPGTSIAGVFTRSATRAAPVLDCEVKLGGPSDAGAAFLVNAGNANAFTGGRGIESVARIAEAVATKLDVPEERVFTASTGVIGEPLPHDRVIEKIDALAEGLAPGAFEPAAQAICTTDTFTKGAGRQIEIGGHTVSIAGIAKGSGMIAPDMATMLVYIFTDADVAQPVLQEIVSRANARTFNCITVDSDTSTSDTVLVAATGASGAPRIDGVEGIEAFAGALAIVMRELAHQVVRDGEGATKFVEIRVTGAANPHDARLAAMAVANSPLVKTAIAGEDPNWGRVVMAIGKSGAQADRDRIAIRFGEVQVAENGWVAPDYSEADAAKHMKKNEIVIAIDLGLGSGRATVWTCDLTHRYIQINADYRS